MDSRRRSLIIIVSAAVAAPLAACQMMLPLGNAEGATRRAVSRMNAIRSEHGLPPLQPDSALESAAIEQSRYMAVAGEMEHDTGWGKGFASRMKKRKIGGVAAENLAHGRMDVDRVIQMWMDSPPHRRNMLDPRLGRFGLAAVEVDPNGDLAPALAAETARAGAR